MGVMLSVLVWSVHRTNVLFLEVVQQRLNWPSKSHLMERYKCSFVQCFFLYIYIHAIKQKNTYIHVPTCKSVEKCEGSTSLILLLFKMPAWCSLQTCPGLDQYAIKKFAEAFEAIPRALAENSGVKANEVISKLYAMHQEGNKNVGFDIEVSSFSHYLLLSNTRFYLKVLLSVVLNS